MMRSLDAEGRATMLEMPQFGVSSSAVRERAAAGRPLRYLVPEPVARFIEEKRVYALNSIRVGESLAGRARRARRLEKARRHRRARHAQASSPTPTSWWSAPPATSARRRRSATRCRVQAEERAGLLPGGVDGDGAAGWDVVDYLDASCTCSRRRRATDTSSRTSGTRRRAWNRPRGSRSALGRRRVGA